MAHSITPRRRPPTQRSRPPSAGLALRGLGRAPGTESRSTRRRPLFQQHRNMAGQPSAAMLQQRHQQATGTFRRQPCAVQMPMPGRAFPCAPPAAHTPHAARLAEGVGQAAPPTAGTVARLVSSRHARRAFISQRRAGTPLPPAPQLTPVNIPCTFPLCGIR